MTADPDMLDIRLEHLMTLLQDASAEERRCLESAIKAVARAREALFHARRNQQNAAARLEIARTTTQRAKADTARLKGALQIIRAHSFK